MPDETSSSNDPRSPRALFFRLVRSLCGAASLVALAFFLSRFNPNVNQPAVDVLWPTAVALWLLAFAPTPSTPMRATGIDVLWVLGFLSLFGALWLPFYDDWRWAYTGDSIGWFTTARNAARQGLWQSALSVRGPDNNATYLSVLAFNWPQFVFSPTLFWHRFGKLVASCLSLAAAYAFFRTTSGRTHAMLIMICTAANYIWQRYSHVSDHLIQSNFFSYSALLLACTIWRRPDRLWPWAMSGSLAGISLFFPQTAWTEIVAAGFVLTIVAIVHRRVAAPLSYAGSFLIGAAPILFQWHEFVGMMGRQAQVMLSWSYLRRIFSSIVWLPYWSPNYTVGAYGPFLLFPFGHLYFAGLALAAVSTWPRWRRSLRVPPSAPVMLALFLWCAVLMTLTNNQYGDPSVKRTHHIIALQIFFATLPLVTLLALSRRRRSLHLLAWFAVAGSLLSYVSANAGLMKSPPAGMYGDNVYDGLVELRQAYPDRPVVLFSSRQLADATLEFLGEAYSVFDTIRIDRSFRLDECTPKLIVCHEPGFDRDRFNSMIERFRPPPRRFPLRNSKEMWCHECAGSLTPQADTNPAAPPSRPGSARPPG